MSDQETNNPEPVNDAGWEWAIVEVFGHRRHAGRAREEERFGAKMLRLDLPTTNDDPAQRWTTIYYAGSSIFSYSLTDEATVMRINKARERPALTRLPPDDDGDSGWEGPL